MSRSRATVLVLSLVLASAGLGAESVLAYAELDTSGLLAYAGTTPLVVDTVDEAGWLQLGPQDFASYDVIWLGRPSTAPFPYGAINFTRPIWGPAVTGHVFVSGLDLESHAMLPGARQLATTVLDWLAGASGTSLYVAPDDGTRGLDFLPWAISGCTSAGCFAQEVAVPALPLHPALLGSTAGSLSGWGTSSLTRILSHPPVWQPVVLGPAGETICLASPAQVQWPGCTITGPPPSIQGGDIPVDFDADDPQGTPLTLSFQWSSDGGGIWLPATPAPGSLLSNPAPGVATPITGGRFLWDSLADGVAMIHVTVVLLRVVADDGVFTGECRTPVWIDNTPRPPQCSILVTPGVATGDFPLTIDAIAPSSTVDVLIEHSLDLGASWSTSTMTLASPTPNPAVGVRAGAIDCIWDTIADQVGLSGPTQPALMRVLVSTARFPTPGECLGAFLVDNSWLPACVSDCGDCDRDGLPIGILDALVAARLGLGLALPSPEQLACCDVDSSRSLDVLDALLIAQHAAALPVILSCP